MNRIKIFDIENYVIDNLSHLSSAPPSSPINGKSINENQSKEKRD
jgi:hypothetical protein